MAWKNKPEGWAGSIYSITNLTNGTQYVGLAENYVVRWNNHVKALKKTKRSRQYIHSVMAAYGVENFKFDVLQHCHTIDTMCRAERKWIKRLHAFVSDPQGGGYNLTKGGDGVFGLRHSKASRKKMSLAHLLRYDNDPLARQMVSEATKRQMADAEKYTRWRASNTASHQTPTARKRNSKAQLKRFKDPIQRINAGIASRKCRTSAVRGRQATSARARWAAMSSEERGAYWRAIHPNGAGGGGCGSRYDGMTAEQRSDYWYATHINGSGNSGRPRKKTVQ